MSERSLGVYDVNDPNLPALLDELERDERVEIARRERARWRTPDFFTVPRALLEREEWGL